MSRRPVRNVAASVRQRLLNLAHGRGEPFQLVLTRYAGERLLFRISQSQYADQFVLKGAMLFSLSGDAYRPTRDLDLMYVGESDIPHLEDLFRDICKANVEEDGLRFIESSVRGEGIRENQPYGGARITLRVRLGQANVQAQVDIGFGDAVTPAPKWMSFPSILEFAGPRLKVYPRETIVAEKFHAMVTLGIANSRMKDFYDIWALAKRFSFKGGMLSKAIRRTFARRRTQVPDATPLALTAEFHEDTAKETQWAEFLRRGELAGDGITLAGVAALIERFLMPPTLAISRDDEFEMVWRSGGPWRPSEKYGKRDD